MFWICTITCAWAEHVIDYYGPKPPEIQKAEALERHSLPVPIFSKGSTVLLVVLLSVSVQLGV